MENPLCFNIKLNKLHLFNLTILIIQKIYINFNIFLFIGENISPFNLNGLSTWTSDRLNKTQFPFDSLLF